MVSSAMLLAACGGGGGSSDATSAPATTTTPTAASFAVTSHTVSVSGGKVFGLAANFFDDRFVPAAPVSNYGFPNPLIQYVNSDGSLDVAWLDYTGGGAVPSASGLAAPGKVFITHIAADLGSSTTTDTGIQTYRLLGFTRDPSGNYYLAFNVDSTFKSSVSGNANNVNGNEFHVARSATASFASPVWNTTVFGNNDNTTADSPGNPGEAGSGVLGFDATNGYVVTYVSHLMAWTANGTRHQAGLLRLLNPNTGAVQTPTGQFDTWQAGSGWFYSHNFDQRLIIDNGTYYTLAHGDAYSRQLGFSAFTPASYQNFTATVFDQSYWTIPGAEGDNTTNAQTGQFIKLANGSFAITHTTSDTRAARDVRLVLANGGNGTTSATAWLTSNTGTTQAIMPKIAPLQSNLLVTWGTWDSASRTNHSVTWYAQLVDQNLSPLGTPTTLSGVEFVAGLPLFTFPAGPNQGAVGWVSGNANGSITVNVAQAGH
ncbi:hypothetical protein [Silvimonas iriomotensis]|nr:hypothetical protein [Silvimonas iriomotensis]